MPGQLLGQPSAYSWHSAVCVHEYGIKVARHAGFAVFHSFSLPVFELSCSLLRVTQLSVPQLNTMVCSTFVLSSCRRGPGAGPSREKNQCYCVIHSPSRGASAFLGAGGGEVWAQDVQKAGLGREGRRQEVS